MLGVGWAAPRDSIIFYTEMNLQVDPKLSFPSGGGFRQRKPICMPLDKNHFALLSVIYNLEL